MASGYQLTRHQLQQMDREHQRDGLPGPVGGFSVDAPMDAQGWPFAPLIGLMGLPPAQQAGNLRFQDLKRQCAAGALMFGRAWSLVDGLRRLRLGLGMLAGVAAAWALWRYWSLPVALRYQVTVGDAAIAGALGLVGMVWPVAQWLSPATAKRNLVLGALLAVFGTLGAWLHLSVAEPRLRERGRLARLLRLPG
jgi:hypothetical protein